jgi:hypothetical protein
MDNCGTDWEFCNPLWGDPDCGLVSTVSVLDDEIKVDDAIAGFGDTVSFGLSKKVRQSTGAEGTIDYDSAQYEGGELAGTVHGFALGGAGAVKSVMKIGVKRTVQYTGVGLGTAYVATETADRIDPSGTTSAAILTVAAYGLPFLFRSRPTSKPSAGKEVVTGENTAHAVRVPGQVTENASKAKARLYRQSRKAKKEKSVSSLDDGTKIKITGEATEVGVATGQDVTSTVHTHPKSQIALFSTRDLAVLSGNYKPTAVHSVVGDKWPLTRRFLGSIGVSLPSTPVVTTITTAEARAAQEAIRKGVQGVVVDVTNYVRGIVP